MDRKQNRNRKHVSTRFSLENLESRQMLAADMATLSVHLPGAIDADLQPAPVQVVAQATATINHGPWAPHTFDLQDRPGLIGQQNSFPGDVEPLPCGVTEDGPRGEVEFTVGPRTSDFQPQPALRPYRQDADVTIGTHTFDGTFADQGDATRPGTTSGANPSSAEVTGRAVAVELYFAAYGNLR